MNPNAFFMIGQGLGWSGGLGLSYLGLPALNLSAFAEFSPFGFSVSIMEGDGFMGADQGRGNSIFTGGGYFIVASILMPQRVEVCYRGSNVVSHVAIAPVWRVLVFGAFMGGQDNYDLTP